MMTQRIDEVQVGVTSRGLRWRWSNQMWHEVGPRWTEERPDEGHNVPYWPH